MFQVSWKKLFWWKLVTKNAGSTPGSNGLTLFKLVQALPYKKEQLIQLNINHRFILSSEVK